MSSLHIGLVQQSCSHNRFENIEKSIQGVITSYSIHYTKLYDERGEFVEELPGGSSKRMPGGCAR